MPKEAFNVGFETANYHRPIQGDASTVFKAREQEIRNNLLRYLGEYRLAVKFDEFYYQQGIDFFGQRYIRAEEDNPIREKFKNAIRQKEAGGLSSKREVAECLGFEKIEQRFLQGDDFLFLWISPPGRKEDGYGDYSFNFLGEVKDRKVRVIPYRNELSMQKHKEIAGMFSNERFETDIDFLAHPIFIEKSEDTNSAEDILISIGEKEAVDTSWRNKLETRLASLIDIFINAVKSNTPESELKRIKRAIENFTIEEKTQISLGEFKPVNFGTKYLVDKYGSYAPPVVGGSCGSSSSKSDTLMDFQSKLNLGNDKYGERTFECPECGKTNVRPKDELLKNCQHCNSSKVAC